MFVKNYIFKTNICEWVSTGSSFIHLDLVVLLLVPHLAASRSRPLQSGAVGPHESNGSSKTIQLSLVGIPFGYTNLLEREKSVDRTSDYTHS